MGKGLNEERGYSRINCKLLKIRIIDFYKQEF